MPIIKSAQKKLRQDKVRTKRNAAAKRAYKATTKHVMDAASAGKKLSEKDVSKAQSGIDKAAKKNLIHPNKASRLKSRVAKLATRAK